MPDGKRIKYTVEAAGYWITFDHAGVLKVEVKDGDAYAEVEKDEARLLNILLHSIKGQGRYGRKTRPC